jgi:hypothetical protein
MISDEDRAQVESLVRVAKGTLKSGEEDRS